MATLETIFLVLLICSFVFFLTISILYFDNICSDIHFRRTLIKTALLFLIVISTIWGCLKYTNAHSDKKDRNEISDKHENTPAIPNSPVQKEVEVPNTTTPPIQKAKPSAPQDAKVIGMTTNGFAITEKDGITYVDGYLIVNKTYSLPSTYVPENTSKPINADNCPNCLDKTVADAYELMRADAAADGITLWIASGYRSYTYQTSLYDGYSKRNGKDQADTYSARPGHSEHQSGLSFDLNEVNVSFAETEEGKWVNENCYKYGFIIRYPKDKDSETGYVYEPWHLRYVGTELAKELYNDGHWITMETYFGITSRYS